LVGWLGSLFDWLAANRALVGWILGIIFVVGIVYLLLFPVREWMSNTARGSSRARVSDLGVAVIVLIAALGIVKYFVVIDVAVIAAVIALIGFFGIVIHFLHK